MVSSPTQTGWERIFLELPIMQELASGGLARISANEISRMSSREPRLMTKFDTRASRPQILRDAGVTILAVENGEYVLVRCDGYKDIEPITEITSYSTDRPSTIETLPWDVGFSSESQVLDASHAASLLGHITGEAELFLTVRGRLRSPKFRFQIDSSLGIHSLEVDGVQVEVDGGYEGDRFYLIEAKMGHRDDFIIRQLYYPYRMWLERGVSKEILPIFLTYSNKVISFRQYRFLETESYHSLDLVEAHNYILGPPEQPPKLQTALADSVPSHLPAGIPFPQADSLQKVIDLVDAIAQGITHKEELAELFEYDPRQSDYYGNAAAFLGLANRTTRGFVPNNNSSAFVQKSHSERIADISSRLCSLPVFRPALEALAAGHLISRDEIAEIIEEQTPLSGSTPMRRSLTVLSWVKWIEQSTQ